ncbi:MAG: inorganic pyrophosphatase Ppa [Desulfobacteraceae bacterium IS3]|nr:MAG: inorganic pyrophosphatase Ppa [Desulfobacteraceae bacterium IS3]
MPIINFLQEAKKFEIQIYRKKKPYNLEELKQNHVSFSGSPLRHPTDAEKIVLVADPYSGNAFYYEFKVSDISYMEELPNLVNPEGETIPMSRIWVKKKSVGVRCLPFLVGDVKII